MFIGSYTYSIDPKSRLSLPVELRRYVKPEANNTFVLTRGLKQCISVYPMDYWNELTQINFNKINPFDDENMVFARIIAPNAYERVLDSQSRFIIPKNLKDFANIQNEVLIIGVLKNIELWNPEVYDEFYNQYKDKYGAIAKEVMKN
ncbi:MAG: division/cell wall cluster transcriptional repressor MraZ [bacterium]